MSGSEEASVGVSRWSFEDVVVLVLAVTVLPVYASGFTTYEVLKEALLVGGGALLLGALAVRALLGQRARVRGWPMLLPLALLGLLALVSSLWAVEPTGAIAGAGRWFALFGVALALAGPASKAARLENLAPALAIGAGAAATIGLLQSMGFETDAHGPHILLDGVYGAFDHERTAALSLACVVPLLAIAVGQDEQHIAGRVVTGIGLALVALYVGVAQAPMAYLVAGLGAAIGVAFVAAFKRPQGLTGLTRPLVALGVAAALMGAGEAATRAGALENLDARMERVARLRGVDLERKNLVVTAADWGRDAPPMSADAQRFAWSAGSQMFLANPAVGVGEGSFDLKSMAYLDRSQPWYHSNFESYPMFRSAHNSYLQLAGELGFGGLAALFASVLLVLLGASRALGASPEEERPHLPRPEVVAAWVGALGAVLVMSVVDSALHHAATGLVFAVAFGALGRDAVLRGGEQGLGRSWSASGASGLERVALAGLMPLVLVGVMGYGNALVTASDFYKARGDVWLKAGGLKQAEEAYREALAIHPRNDLALLNLANVLGVGQSRDAAEQALIKALEVRPFDARLYTALGVIQMRMALNVGRKRSREKAEDPETYKQPSPEELQELFSEFDREIMQRAENNLKTALELHPHNLNAYKELTNVHMTRRDTEKARITILENIEEVEAHNKAQASELYLKLGQVYMQDEKWAMAKKHLEKALELDLDPTRRKLALSELQRAQAKLDGRPEPDPHGHNHGGGMPGMPGMPKGVPGGAPPGDLDAYKKAPHADGHEGEGHKEEAGDDAPGPPGGDDHGETKGPE